MRISVNRIDLDDKVLQKPVLKDYAETLVTANAGLSYTVDCTRANTFKLTLTADCEFTFSNPPASGTAGTLTLILVQDDSGSRTVTWPSSVQWPGGTAPTLATTADTGTDILTFITTDAGTTWHGVHAMADASVPPPVEELWAWGRNHAGQLGQGNTTYRSSPTQVGAETTWAQVEAGWYRSLAIKTDGTLWAWGSNSGGSLGLGDAANRSSPVQVGALTTWSQALAGNNHSIALRTDGTIWTWGDNQWGQLGRGDTVSRSSPVQVGALTTWASVFLGSSGSFAIKTDGTLWAWGHGGNLGINDLTYRSSPVQVGALTDWLKVAADAAPILAIKTDGTLWAWGSSTYGQLGVGDTVARSSPVQVGALATWTKISVGRGHAVAITSS